MLKPSACRRQRKTSSPTKKQGTLAILLAWALLGLTPVVAPAQDEQEGPPPALVRLAPVEQETLQDRRPVVGRLREVRRAVISAEQSGKLTELPVEAGDTVEAGQTVLARVETVWAKIDVAEMQADLAEAQAQVQQFQASLDRIRLDRQQIEELQASRAAKPREVEVVRAEERAAAAQLEAARARVSAAQASLSRAQEALSKLVLRAPFDGVVVRKMAEQGEWVDAGAPVVEMISRGELDAVLDVPERLVNNLSLGDAVPMRIDALDMELDAVTHAIVPVSDNSARTFPVKLRLHDRDGVLKAGMSATAFIPTGEPVQALVVPRDAVSRSASGAVVWGAYDGQAMSVKVRVLFGDGDRYVIEPIAGAGPPLQPGMQVVVEGAERLFPTRPITTPQASQAGPSADAQ